MSDAVGMLETVEGHLATVQAALEGAAVKIDAQAAEITTLRAQLASAIKERDGLDQERDGFAQLCAVRTRERDAAQEQADSFKAMYRQACDWRDEKIATATAEIARLRAELAKRNAAEQEAAKEAFILHIQERGLREAAEAESDRLRRALEDARDALRNDFEPDNQSKAWHRANEALKEQTP